MKMNKEAEYIYINRTESDGRRITLTAEKCCGVRWLNVHQIVKKGTEPLQCKLNKQLGRKIKRYCGNQTVILGNEKAVRELELSNRLFHLRKQEFKNNVQDVLRYFQSRTGCELVVSVNGKRRETDSRSRFLLLLESVEWSYKEIAEILWVVKDFYEDIYIVMGKKTIDQEKLQDYFCEECGIVLHVITTDAAKQLSVDAVLFLLENWNKDYKNYLFRMGYVVSEWEKDMVRRRKMFRKTIRKGETVDRELYGGFVYEYEKKQIPYEKAIVCSIDGKGGWHEENPISIVAIYSVE